MLILSRKKGQSIIIDGKIEVKVMETVDGKIKLGIEAPEDIEILRSELYVEVENENKNAIGKKVNLDDMKKLLNRQSNL